MNLDDAEKQDLLVWLKEDYYETYRQAMNGNLLANHQQPEAVGIAYTAMHGVGANMAKHC